MPKYSFTKKAVKDLSLIWNYSFETWSEKQADKYYQDIIKECNRLAINPEKGKTYYEIVDSLKAQKVNKHIIFYRTLGKQEIEIERVLHERMDLKSRMLE